MPARRSLLLCCAALLSCTGSQPATPTPASATPTATPQPTTVAPGPAPEPAERPAATGPWTGNRPANVAALLALAHHVQRLIDAGRIADRAEVARRLHWTRARVSQVMDLLLLAPDIQEALLFLEAGTHVTERALRAVVRHEDWQGQRGEWCKIRPA